MTKTARKLINHYFSNIGDIGCCFLNKKAKICLHNFFYVCSKTNVFLHNTLCSMQMSWPHVQFACFLIKISNVFLACLSGLYKDDVKYNGKRKLLHKNLKICKYFNRVYLLSVLLWHLAISKYDDLSISSILRIWFYEQ